MKAICILKDKDVDKGFVLFSKCCKKHPVKVEFHLKNFGKNSIHAIHIHEFGDTSDGCKSLGKHYNPYNTTHGTMLIKNMERHAGDLINNFTTDNNGQFNYFYYDKLLSSIESILGRSVVIHKDKDDLGLGDNEESLISGNAGERIVCGVIGLKKSD
jgi:Cu-Zn family superoxide dismutase